MILLRSFLLYNLLVYSIKLSKQKILLIESINKIFQKAGGFFKSIF